MIATLAKSPATVGGIAALAVGVGLQAAALHGAPLTFVEPVLVAELPLTLLLAALICRSRLDRRGWSGIAITAAGLAGLLLAARPSGGDAARPGGLAWAVAVPAGVGLAGLLLGAGLRAGGARRAALLALAAGTGHGLSATLMKATTFDAAEGASALFGSWQLYATIAVGGGAVFLYQNALQAGPLIAAQPALGVSDPAISAAYGVMLFGEHVRAGAWLAPEALGIVALLYGVLLVSRSAAQNEEPSGARPRRRQAALRHAATGRGAG